MTTVKILGISGSQETERLKANVQLTISRLGMMAVIEQVSGVNELMKYHINGIPALVVNDTVVLQKRVPEVEELEVLLKVFSEMAVNQFVMKKFLIPVDFSPVSENAVHFALELSAIQDGRLRLLHVYHPEFDPQNPYLNESLITFLDDAKIRLDTFADKFKQISASNSQVSHKINRDVTIGFPVEEILNEAEKSAADMIVMGTTGSAGVIGKLFGSVSTNVAKKAECPVMLIPPGITFKGFRHILYASDYESATETTLRRMVELAETFHSDIHFVHVESEVGTHDFKEIENRLFKILFQGGEPAFSFTMSKVEGNSVVEGLNDYASRHDIDLMVLVCPHRSFWENVFHKSVSKEIMLNTKIPILVLHQ